MLKTVKEREQGLANCGLLGVEEDDYLDPNDAPKIVARQLEVRARITQCHDEIATSLKNAEARSREEDLVGWLAEELRREFLNGYLAGLEESDAVFENLADGSPVKVVATLCDNEFYRRRAVDRIARINEGLLRRAAQKAKRGAAN